MKLPIKLITACLLAPLPLQAQHNPHSDAIDYTEDFRGQYFFSPKSGWMNDINGLVYQGGKYHIIYQWCKGGRRGVKHGGYATSPDLMHWKDEGAALIPTKTFLPKELINVSGAQVYSGSAVVVSGETAVKITGSEKEAIIAIYTGTKVGTCLAWSNDSGKTWHDYKNNPVAHPTTGTVPRDPAVSWWEDPDKSDGDQSKWILGIYEVKNKIRGTDFYGSQDLITWTHLSRIDFGYECPDLFWLPLDGDMSVKQWVMHDANGSYLVGHFNGTEFIPDAGHDGSANLVLNVGPDFYAAQTFPRGNLPGDDPRIIQIAWNDHWNGGIDRPNPIWERNATFPVSVTLLTYKGKMRVARNPIKEISSLYLTNVIFKEQTLKSGSNILKDIKSKKFDLIAEFDLTGTTAKTFGIKIANKTITYDVANKTLLGKSLEPDAAGKITIRVLADWGMYEVFSNRGIFSYSQQFAFTPASQSVEVFTDGDLKLVSLEFHEIKRTWFSAPTKINDH